MNAKKKYDILFTRCVNPMMLTRFFLINFSIYFQVFSRDTTPLIRQQQYILTLSHLKKNSYSILMAMHL